MTMKILILICLLMSMNQFAEAAIDPYQEAIDQTAHFTIGTVISYGLAHAIGLWAAPVVIAGAYIREIQQHDGPTDGVGTKRDMLFWSVGAIFGAHIQ